MSLQTLELRRGSEVRRAVFSVVDDAALLPFSVAPELMLSAAELAQYAQLRFPQKRQGFMLGRLAAKSALGAMLTESDLPRIGVRPGVFGQPLADHPRSSGIEVTVSHSSGLAVALAYPADWPIGVDLETVAAAAVATVLDQIDASADEQAWLAAEAIGRSAACGVLWTAREALGKALKTGLNSPLGILSLCDFHPAGADSTAPWWAGGYTNFPQFRWLAQVFGERILTLCLPREIKLIAPPCLP